MKLRLIKVRDTLSDSFWFLPALMAFAAALAAMGSVAIDHKIGEAWMKDIGWVWSGGADGARGVLSVVAGSVMTVVSIVFSLTISVLAETSSHFGPRVLRNFTSDRKVQFTLGTFISTFVYCLLVLRTVRTVEEMAFVPYLSVNIGVFLALASLAVLIFFIHHIAQSIQAENLIADVGRDFQHALPALFPDRKDGESETDEQDIPKEKYWKNAREVDSHKNGYLQRVDDEQLMRLAKRHDLQIDLQKRPGEFVGRNSPLLRALPPERVSDVVAHSLCDCFSIGLHRTPYQDALYSIQQLVEIAAHALSPGINEPYTALTAIDWLGASLRGVAMRDLPSPLRFDNKGELRILANPLNFEELSSAAFNQIRLYGATNPDIMASLLDLIASLAPDLHRDSDREILREHAAMIGADASQIVNQSDRARVMEFLSKAQFALNQSTPLAEQSH